MMTLSKFILFSFLWLVIVSKSDALPSNDTLAICFAILCAGAIAKEEK